MSPLREEIIVALEREAARIEGVKGAWRGDAAGRLHSIEGYLEKLRGPGVCFMEIRGELKPWEIKL